MHRTRLAALVIGVTALGTASTGVAVAGHVGFTDGPFGVHEAGVHYVSDAGITAGCNAAQTRYCPADGVTRAQMATFMHRLSGNAAGVGPSVDAARVGGTPADQVLIGAAATTATVVNGFGAAECPVGTTVVGGGYRQPDGQANIVVSNFNLFEPDLGDFWVVEMVDPATGGLAGGGSVQALCAVSGGFQATAQSERTLADDALRARVRANALDSKN